MISDSFDIPQTSQPVDHLLIERLTRSMVAGLTGVRSSQRRELDNDEQNQA